MTDEDYLRMRLEEGAGQAGAAVQSTSTSARLVTWLRLFIARQRSATRDE